MLLIRDDLRSFPGRYVGRIQHRNRSWHGQRLKIFIIGYGI